jgi:hypothetical protein
MHLFCLAQALVGKISNATASSAKLQFACVWIGNVASDLSNSFRGSLERRWRTIRICPAPVCTPSKPTHASLKSRRQSIHSSGLPDLKILKLFVVFLPIKAPGSDDDSSLRLLVFSPIEFSFSGTHVELGHNGIMALAKALICLSFFGIGLDTALVTADLF